MVRYTSLVTFYFYFADQRLQNEEETLLPISRGVFPLDVFLEVCVCLSVYASSLLIVCSR